MIERQARMDRIVELAKANQVVSYQGLAEELGVSSMTIRRDLDLLAADNVLTLIRGGAVFNESQEDTVPSYMLKSQNFINPEEKARIGQKAASLLKPRDTIIIDSGSTSYYLAKALPADMELNVLCWSLNVIVELTQKPKCRLLAGGGEYHREVQSFVGSGTLDMLHDSRAEKLFLTAGGFHNTLGITTPLAYETEVKRAAIDSSLTKILLLDSTKFGRVCQSMVTVVSNIDIIITDSKIPKDYLEYIQSQGIELIIV